jgi:molybdenum cofactor cytidylyltransferase
MGYPKALLPLGDTTFIGRILDTCEAVGLAEPCVVLGRDADGVLPTLKGRRVRILRNPDPGRGQISSIQIALASLEPRMQACLIWPVDHPDVSADVVRALVRVLARSQTAVLAMPACRGKRGHPSLFRRQLFEELLRTPVAGGAKPVFLARVPETVLFPCSELSTIEDIDTPEDYRRFTGESLEAALSRRNPSIRIRHVPSEPRQR